MFGDWIEEEDENEQLDQPNNANGSGDSAHDLEIDDFDFDDYDYDEDENLDSDEELDPVEAALAKDTHQGAYKKFVAKSADIKKITSQENLQWNGMDVPILRAGMPEIFVALQPPMAQPYIMASTVAQPQQIVDFFVAQIPRIEELRKEMLKRYDKSPTRKCRYQTGDVAYVMGRPFQLRVYPLSQQNVKIKSGARGRTRYKFSIDPAVSMLQLYVVHPGNYDEGKKAFSGYAEPVILRNAEGLVSDFTKVLMPGQKAPAVRMREMRGRWSSFDAGALWISTDLVPYPPDCLVYVILREMEKMATVTSKEFQAQLERILPDWRTAARILQERPEPYSLQ